MVDIKSKLEAFNSLVKSKATYNAHRKVSATKTFFYDDENIEDCEFNIPDENWCNIGPDLASFLETSHVQSKIIKFSLADEDKLCNFQPFFDSVSEQLPELLSALSYSYIDMHQKLSETLDSDSRAELNIAISKIRDEISHGITNLFNSNSVVKFIDEKLAPVSRISNTIYYQKSRKLGHEKIENQVFELKKSGKYTVKEICGICGIKRSRYYGIIGKKKHENCALSNSFDRSTVKTYLGEEGIIKIKEILDNPKKSVNCSGIRNKLWEQFHLEVPQSTIYYHIKRTLGYSFKKNRFKPRTFFERAQHVVNFKVSEMLLDQIINGRHIIALDESGFYIGDSEKYSYSKKGERAFKQGGSGGDRYNVIMAINNRGVFGYQIRLGTHNEHSVAAFLLDITKKLYENGKEYAERTTLFLDNAVYHRSRMIMSLCDLLPFTILYNSPNWSDANPIEHVFGIIKEQLRKKHFNAKY